MIKYKRILLKLSGEALAGSEHNNFGLDPKVIDKLVAEVAELVELGVEVALVVGGGNFLRGKSLSSTGLVDRVTADQMGMLATIMNALVFRDAFARSKVNAVVMSAIPILGMVEGYEHTLARQYLKNGKVIILAAGTGNCLVTTDSAATLRALEINADVLMKATKVAGIYPMDPETSSNLQYYKKLTYKEILDKELAFMDLNALIQARDHKLTMIVFNINSPNSLLNLVQGKEEGTIVQG